MDNQELVLEAVDRHHNLYIEKTWKWDLEFKKKTRTKRKLIKGMKHSFDIIFTTKTR